MRERILARIASLALTRPYAVLAVAVLGALASLALVPSLRISSSRFELIDEEGRVGASLAELNAHGELVAAVTCSDPERARATVDALAQRLAGLRETRAVFHRIDPTLFRGRELLHLSRDELAMVLSMARAPADAGTLVERARRGLAPDDETTLDALDDEPEEAIDPLLGLRSLRGLLEALDGWLRDPTQRELALGPARGELPIDDDGYLVSRDGRTRYLFVTPRIASDRYEDVAPLTMRARAIARELTQPGVRIAFTGYPAIAVDEVDAIRGGSFVTTVVSAILVMLVFWLGFRSMGSVIVAGVPLALAIAWAFGMIVLGIGELNLLTQAAAPVFAGLGIDFAVHILAEYDRARRAGKAHDDAIRAALLGPGAGIFTGALTTSAAFLALVVAEYDAFRELGIVTGVGLLLVMMVMLFVTPALLTIGERRGWAWLRVGARARPKSRLGASFAALVTARPRLVLVAGALVTIGLALGVDRIGFDPNVESLLPADAESVTTAHRMVTGSAFSNEVLAAEASDMDALRTLTDRLMALPHVGRVESAALLVPDDQQAKLTILRAAQVGEPSAARTSLADLRTSLEGLSREASRASRETRAAGATAIADELAAVAREARSTRRALDGADEARVRAFDAELARGMHTLRGMIEASRAATPITLRDVPVPLRARLVRRDHGSLRYLVHVHPAGDVFRAGALDAFIREVRSVDPDVVGYPIAFSSFLDRMQSSLRTALVLAAILVTLLLAIDLRALRDVALALVPVALGATWLLGLMGWLGVDANMANLAALPLVLGVGVDNGVHLIHRWRQEGRVAPALTSILNALVLTSTTTLAGFGTLVLASHRGMQSFAVVMVIGISACLVATLVILPALMRVAHER